MAGPHSMKELIGRKRDGGRLGTDEIEWLIGSFTVGAVPDYQMASMLMAVLWRGLDGTELSAWTDAMLHSGDVLDFSDVARPKVDKHSTGGVGDKVSIPLAPMVAACGIAVPMMSGRGLGHTGGTLDKLETIPGFRAELGQDEFGRVLRRRGLVMGGQSETLVPADRLLYALRDVTGTVPSVPLIASSIMSKKLAEGLDGLVLDVKVGSGAFMRELEDARGLARTMVDIGAAHGTKTVALITAMDQPLGREVGNASEIRESMELLHGAGPADLTELVYRLGAEMLTLGGMAADADEARLQLDEAVASGAAAEVFRGVVADQGGDPNVVDDPSLLPAADGTAIMESPVSGWVTACDALVVGRAALRLGAGREVRDDAIDPAVGITIMAKVGDRVEAGQPLAEIAWNMRPRLESALAILAEAWVVGSDPPADPGVLIVDEVR